jgi:hypothetical protein
LAASILFYEADAVNRILESVWSLSVVEVVF